MTNTHDSVPKAILYSWPTSVWSTVPLLCLFEKGYSEDEYIVRYVNICTVPTLVVPTLETTGADVDTRYRSLRDTISICDFLDHARSSSTGHVQHQDKPAPTLAPATIEGKGISDSIINLIHTYTVDPNFLALSARNEAELKEKVAGPQGKALNLRREALQGYLKEAKQAVADSAIAPKEGTMSWEQKTVKFLEEKINSNEQIWEIYHGKGDMERQQQFFGVSRESWTRNLLDTMNELESLFKGPYVLGDQVSLADLHCISWLTRIVHVAGGTANAAGLESISPYMGGYTFGPKMRKFWEEWVERDSFKKVLVPASKAFGTLNGSQ
ncbi:uncharacterized protein IL334_006683 [Kwoniella shivajii]|uniref:GST C-terminal domain-containing protein n=1 Tax=Kwoniella shivajii TaxID=564305 RepID=A0ABZ1D6Z2_9TREE|nr:hypothetical protein IL334_006683 [Kwoniella shivajii]